MSGKTIKGKITRVDAKDKKVKIVFEYAGTKSSDAGGGPRGIDVWKQGTRGRAEYEIDPNPHDNRKYNKKQANFYADLADGVVDKYIATEKFPKSVKVTWGGEAYTLKS